MHIYSAPKGTGQEDVRAGNPERTSSKAVINRPRASISLYFQGELFTRIPHFPVQ
jgi:hypothetical protein